MESIKDYDVRSFSGEEIEEINQYVVAQVPYSQLSSLFILTEEPEKKIRIFTIIYRIITSSKDYVENPETKKKLSSLLSLGEDTYNALYPFLIKYDNTKSTMMKISINKKLLEMMLQNNEIINKFINSFVVFAEKIDLISTDSVAGIKMDEDEGKDLISKARNLIKE